MKKILLSMATASALLVSASALAETTTTTTWTASDGTVIREYSTTQKYAPVSVPNFNPTVGVALPANVQVYSLPSTVKVADPDRYSYTIINDQPVVVERSTRRVVHIW
jgi:hypothetical protein